MAPHEVPGVCVCVRKGAFPQPPHSVRLWRPAPGLLGPQLCVPDIPGASRSYSWFGRAAHLKRSKEKQQTPAGREAKQVSLSLRGEQPMPGRKNKALLLGKAGRKQPLWTRAEAHPGLAAVPRSRGRNARGLVAEQRVRVQSLLPDSLIVPRAVWDL